MLPVPLGYMLIIVTNGVSFSLVAGSCCIVEFKYVIDPTGIGQATSLNINSTGAKYLAISRPFAGSSTAGYGSFGRFERNTDTTGTAIMLGRYQFLIYNGSRYSPSIGMTEDINYGDYGD